jgi:hypothetical protein
LKTLFVNFPEIVNDERISGKSEEKVFFFRIFFDKFSKIWKFFLPCFFSKLIMLRTFEEKTKMKKLSEFFDQVLKIVLKTFLVKIILGMFYANAE